MSEIKKELDKLNHMCKDGISFSGRKFQYEKLIHLLSEDGRHLHLDWQLSTGKYAVCTSKGNAVYL